MPLHQKERQSGYLAEPLLHTSEEDALGARKPVTMKQQGQFIPYSSASSSTVMLINQRKWNDILAVGNIEEKSFKISKLMTRLVRHQGHPQEDDEATEWRSLFPAVCRGHLDSPNGRSQCGWTIRGEEVTRKDFCVA